MQQLIKSVVSVSITTLVYLLGDWDIALQSLIVVIILDYLTGISKSYVSKKLNSTRGIKGIVKKLSMLCMVAVAVIIDKIVGNTGIVRTLIIYYLVANEGLSIIENLGEMDIIVPNFLKEKLEQLKDKTTKDGDIENVSNKNK